MVKGVDSYLLHPSAPERRRDTQGWQHDLFGTPYDPEVGRCGARPFEASRAYEPPYGAPRRPVAPVDHVRETGLFCLPLGLDA